MVSTCPLIFKSSHSCTNPLVTVPSAPITIGITITFMFHCFSVLKQDLGIYLFFSFPSVLPCGQSEWQSSLFGRFSFIVDSHQVWLSGRDKVICFCLKIPEDFVDLILHDGLRVAHIVFDRMVKFKLLVKFSVNHLLHLIVSYAVFVLIYCIRLLCD